MMLKKFIMIATIACAPAVMAQEQLNLRVHCFDSPPIMNKLKKEGEIIVALAKNTSLGIAYAIYAHPETKAWTLVVLDENNKICPIAKGNEYLQRK